MKQKTLTAIVLLMATATLLAGCNNEPSKPQTVFMNLGTIATETGINEQITERTETLKQQLTEEMKTLSAKLNKEFEDEKAGFGDSPSEEDEKKIQALLEQLNKQIMQARYEGSEKYKKEASEIRQSYLDDIMSAAQVVAVEHGASIILKAREVFWSDGSVDITDEVLGRMPGGKDTQPADSEQS